MRIGTDLRLARGALEISNRSHFRVVKREFGHSQILSHVSGVLRARVDEDTLLPLPAKDNLCRRALVRRSNGLDLHVFRHVPAASWAETEERQRGKTS